jgi:anti-sigma factor RsiW
MDMSAYVLDRLLPAAATRFQELTAACSEDASARFALAELNSFLSRLGAGELRAAVAFPPPAGLRTMHSNYIAAMVEYASAHNGIAPPHWTSAIAPLAEPTFGSELKSLRLYLLTHSPPPFRRRNIFIDASLGARV